MTTILAINIYDSLYSASEGLTAQFSNLISIATVLAAMLAAFSLMRVSTSYVKGGDQFAWELIRPMLILFAVMNFGTLCSGFESLVAVFTQGIVDNSDTDWDDIFQAIKNAITERVDEPEEPSGKDGWLAKALYSFWQFVSRAVPATVGGIAAYAAKIFMNAMFFLFQVFAFIVLTFLKIIGPFAFALSIQDEFRSGIATWVGRFIQTVFWIPIGFLLTKMMVTFCEISLTKIIMLGGGEGWLTGVLIAGMCIVFASTIWSIPQFASYIVESAGTAKAEDSAMQGAGRNKVAGKWAGGKAISASKAIGTAARKSIGKLF